jgi:hypothetical protein
LNLKALLVQFVGIKRHSGQVSAGRAKAAHQAASDRIACRRDNERDGRCRSLGQCGGRYADDHVGRKFDDLGGGRVERLPLFVGKLVLDCNILAVDVAQIAKALDECVDKVLGPRRSKIDD